MYLSPNLEEDSKLFLAPTEIRDAIYHYILPSSQIHIFSQGGKIQISECISQSPRSSDYIGGFERRTTGEKETDFIWARRLLSSWGFHWKCEEAALGIGECCGTSLQYVHTPLFLVCKRMSIELSDFITRTMVVDVIGLEPLSRLLGRDRQSAPSTHPSFSLLSYLFLRIRQLSVTLRLPFLFFKSLEEVANAPIPEFTPADSDATKWLRLCPKFSRLEMLQSLQVWFDNSDPNYWVDVNERATLSPLLFLSSSISLDIYLPKLHPGKGTAERHYTETSIPPSVNIHRLLRQKYRGVLGRDVQRCVENQEDFPFFIELIDWSEYEGWTHESLEEAERRCWRMGIDLLYEMRNMNGTPLHPMFPRPF